MKRGKREITNRYVAENVNLEARSSLSAAEERADVLGAAGEEYPVCFRKGFRLQVVGGTLARFY